MATSTGADTSGSENAEDLTCTGYLEENTDLWRLSSKYFPSKVSFSLAVKTHFCNNSTAECIITVNHNMELISSMLL